MISSSRMQAKTKTILFVGWQKNFETEALESGMMNLRCKWAAVCDGRSTEDSRILVLALLYYRNTFLITTQAKRNLSSHSGIGGVRSAT